MAFSLTTTGFRPSDILDLSKIEAGKIEIRQEEFQVSEVIQSVQDIFLHVASQPENSLSMGLDEHVPERLIGDSTRLTQNLLNVVGMPASTLGGVGWM